ncbi:flippase [Kordia sp.]|uniref:flippase n=1 Tax=Kordia sp. TaxID=1965332 RepID=UPI003D2CCA58
MKLSSLYKNKLSKHLLVSLIIQGIYTIVTPLSMILLARFLGPDNFGHFAFAVSFATVLSIFSNLGLPTAVTRFGAIYYINENWKRLKGILQFSNKNVTICGLVFIAVSIFLLLTDIVEIPSKPYVLVALPIILFLALSMIRTGVLTAIEKVNLSQLPEMIIRPILFFIVILVLYYSGVLNAYSSIISYTIINGIIFLVGAYMVKRFTDKKMANLEPDYEKSAWKRSAMPLFLLGSIQILGAQADIFLLGFLADSEEVGIFKSMYQISLLIIFSLSAINAVASPYIVRSFEENNFAKLKKLLFTFCGINLVFALVIAFPFLFFGEFFIELLYGEEFVVGITCLQILIFGRIINSIFGISNQFLKMMGEERKATKGIFIGAVVGIILNFVLIPQYGIIGAAIASSSALIIWNLYLFAITVKKVWSIPTE